jgi:hypothetical protein
MTGADGTVMAPAPPGEPADPFGRTVAERVWRRLAGAGVAVLAAGVGSTLWISDLLFAVLIGTAVIYLLGVPASWLIARRPTAPVSRHLIAALPVGALAAALVSLLTRDPSWLPAMTVIGIGIGIPVAVVAAWSGLKLPDPWVKPVAVAGLLVSVFVLPLASWWESRPPAPYDFVLVHEPAEVRHHFRSPYALARDLAERFEDKAAQNHPPVAHATWTAIGRDLTDAELANIPAWLRYTPDEDLPTSRATGDPIRLVTTIYDNHPHRACVIVTDTRIRAQPHACAELNLIR